MRTDRIAVGVDIGGTFTDIALRHADGLTQTGKVLTTPEALEQGVVAALRQAGLRGSDVEFFVHGTTAGLNALLERRFETVGLLTTAGFRDAYEIGRANRPDMYDLHYHRQPPLVERRLRLEVVERISAHGEVIVPLDEESVRHAADQLVSAEVRAIAVALLHAYANPSHELRCARLLTEWYPQLRVSLSHQVANEWREYERTSTTVVNAAVATTVDAYLRDLESKLSAEGVAAGIHVMQSNGGMTTASRARRKPVNTLLSGPVGGALAAALGAREKGFRDAIAVDMGGTSFDVSLIIGGEPELAREASLEGQPLLLSVVDVHTIGSGGGSVAWASASGLRVGPRSAGAVPGPACYGHGGVEPTVTDANVHLDRVNANYFLGGTMRLHPERARRALERLGTQLGMETERLAAGILEVVNARMASLIRQITIGRGLDPRDFALIAFGGAGPMHAVFLAEELDIGTVLVPFSPGTLSAQGMLSADIVRDITQPYFVAWERIDIADVGHTMDDMRADGAKLLQEDGVRPRDRRFKFSADIRYVGQEHALTVACTSLDEVTLKRFHRLYRRTFGHASADEAVEVVALRLKAIGLMRRAKHFTPPLPGNGEPYSEQEIWFRDGRVPTNRYRRVDLRAGQRLDGPLVVDEASCTTVVPAGWLLTVDETGGMAVTR